MAILNFITQGTYSIIDDVQYVRRSQYMKCILEVYSDSTKKVHLCSKVFDLNGLTNVPGVLSLNQNTIPQNSKLGDSYVVGLEATEGEWSKNKGIMAKWSLVSKPTETLVYDWVFWTFAVGQTIYNEEDRKYYVYKENYQLDSFICLNDSRIWTNNFTPTLIAENGLHSQIYNFLKTLPGFENAIDG